MEPIFLQAKGEANDNNLDKQIRTENTFTSIVDRKLFEAGSIRFLARSYKRSDEEMLESLRRFLQRYGFVSELLINEAGELPSANIYKKRFDGLLRAYHLIGFIPDRDTSFVEESRIAQSTIGVSS